MWKFVKIKILWFCENLSENIKSNKANKLWKYKKYLWKCKFFVKIKKFVKIKIICENKNFKLSRSRISRQSMSRKQSSSSFKRFNNEENDINFNNQLDFVDNVLEIISGNENDIGFSKDNYDIVKNYFDNPHFDKNSDYNRSEHNIFYK